MSTAQQPYYTCIRRTLHSFLCICNTPSMLTERQNRPEVETAEEGSDLLLNRILIRRTDQEVAYIEGSINSVRASFSFQKSDPLAELIAKKYVDFLGQRADSFNIMRRKPLPGYDISFLITNEQVETMNKERIIDFIIQFIADIDQDISSMKLGANNRGRRAAHELFQKMCF